MKKTIVLLLTLSLLLSLTACGGEQPPKTAEIPEESASKETERAPEQGLAEEAEKTPEKEPEKKQETPAAPEQGPEKSVEPEKEPEKQEPEVVAPEGPAETVDEPLPAEPAPEAEPASEPEPTTEPEPVPEKTIPTAEDAAAYIGQSAGNLLAGIGAPNSTTYASSCLGDGEDGEWYYTGFTVYTYRDENGDETIQDVM